MGYTRRLVFQKVFYSPLSWHKMLIFQTKETSYVYMSNFFIAAILQASDICHVPNIVPLILWYPVYFLRLSPVFPSTLSSIYFVVWGNSVCFQSSFLSNIVFWTESPRRREKRKGIGSEVLAELAKSQIPWESSPEPAVITTDDQPLNLLVSHVSWGFQVRFPARAFVIFFHQISLHCPFSDPFGLSLKLCFSSNLCRLSFPRQWRRRSPAVRVVFKAWCPPANLLARVVTTPPRRSTRAFRVCRRSGRDSVRWRPPDDKDWRRPCKLSR